MFSRKITRGDELKVRRLESDAEFWQHAITGNLDGRLIDKNRRDGQEFFGGTFIESAATEMEKNEDGILIVPGLNYIAGGDGVGAAKNGEIVVTAALAGLLKAVRENPQIPLPQLYAAICAHVRFRILQTKVIAEFIQETMVEGEVNDLYDFSGDEKEAGATFGFMRKIQKRDGIYLEEFTVGNYQSAIFDVTAGTILHASKPETIAQDFVDDEVCTMQECLENSDELIARGLSNSISIAGPKRFFPSGLPYVQMSQTKIPKNHRAIGMVYGDGIGDVLDPPHISQFISVRHNLLVGEMILAEAQRLQDKSEQTGCIERYIDGVRTTVRRRCFDERSLALMIFTG